MVFAATGLTGLEPATSAVTVRHSNQAELQPRVLRARKYRSAQLPLQ